MSVVATYLAPQRQLLRAWLLDAQRVDVAVYDAITRTPTPSLDRGMSKLTQVADYSRLWLGCAAILAATRGPRGRRRSHRACLDRRRIGRCQPRAEAARPARAPGYHRRTRCAPAPMPASRSFPSGHSASAFAFATGVGSILPRDAIPIRALATVVAYSRVHTGVHYPGDVLAGAFLGTTLAQITAGVVGRGSRSGRRHPRSSEEDG